MKVVKTFQTCFEPCDDDTYSHSGWRLRLKKELPSSRRRKRLSKKIHSVYEDPEKLKACDNVHIECAKRGDELVLRVRRTDMWGKHVRSTSDTVVVAVEATHICPLDIRIRQSSLQNAPFVTGSNFVGVVHCGDLSQGTRVAGITVAGANARYVTTTTDKLIPVPSRVDESELVLLVSTYLPMFQAIHHGSSCRRYSKFPLKGKNVLLTLGASLSEVHAAVRIALLQGAKNVYVVCPMRNHDFIDSIEAVPLDADSEEWRSRVRGKIDVALEFDYSATRDVVHSAVSQKGRLIWVQQPQRSSFTSWVDQALMSLHDRSFIYNLFSSWERSRDTVRRDIRFLVQLLHKRKLRPVTDRFISLSGIPQAHRDLQRHQGVGAIICEPWKEI